MTAVYVPIMDVFLPNMTVIVLDLTVFVQNVEMVRARAILKLHDWFRICGYVKGSGQTGGF